MRGAKRNIMACARLAGGACANDSRAARLRLGFRQFGPPRHRRAELPPTDCNGATHGLGRTNSACRPHEGHLQERTAEHGMGRAVPRPAGTCVQVPLRADGPQGRRTGPRQCPDLRDRSADRHHGAHGRALFGRHQGRPDRRHRLLELRRQGRRRAQARRLGHGHRRGSLEDAGLSLGP